MHLLPAQEDNGICSFKKITDVRRNAGRLSFVINITVTKPLSQIPLVPTIQGALKNIALMSFSHPESE